MIEVIFNAETESDILLEKILRYKIEKKLVNESLIEVILDYCFEYDLNIDEIGYILGESKEFSDYFEKDLIQENFIKGKKIDRKSDINIEEWN